MVFIMARNVRSLNFRPYGHTTFTVNIATKRHIAEHPKRLRPDLGNEFQNRSYLYSYFVVPIPIFHKKLKGFSFESHATRNNTK